LIRVLTDDITFFDDPFYQDGVTANAVTRARNAGVPFFSSAANSNITRARRSDRLLLSWPRPPE
jgi:hypothetical protein